MVLTSSESDQYSSAQKEMSKLPLKYMTGYFCRPVYVLQTKALISFMITAKLICTFVFTYAKSSFSHKTAQDLFSHEFQLKLDATCFNSSTRY